VRGRVAAYDEHRGIGEVTDAEGHSLPFHCTAIADGSRTIPSGVEVDFRVVNGPLGVTEATEIRRVAA